MTIGSLDVFILTAIFVLPGFLVVGIMDSINPPKKRSDGTYFLKCLTLSIINLACWSWLYSLIFHLSLAQQFLYYLFATLATLIGAAVLALIIAIVVQRGVISRCLSRFKINAIHPIPTAWDYYFSKQKGSFIVVTLLDGTQLMGWFSTDSFASSDADERDLYVERGYKIGDGGDWLADEDSVGFYIPKGQIKHIEFKKGDQSNE